MTLPRIYPILDTESLERRGVSIETAAAVAKELGIAFVPGAPDGLTTFDGSHLNQSSAERWSSAFFQAAVPQIRSCLKGTSRSRG